jgi:predicted ATPase
MADPADIATAAELLSEAQRNLLHQENVPFYKFVLTGGPCGGKTTALARLFSFLRERNFEVVSVPEAWGILTSHGMSLDFFSTEGIGPIVQGTVMDVQKAMEDGAEKVLKARGKPAILLCDRGLMDGAVYISDDDFEAMLQERDTNRVQIRDHRYDACFHLVTAADGAEAFYTLDNNQVRTESRDDAIQVDRRTQAVWLGHPHLYVIDNSTDFEGKLKRLVDIVSKLVGLPSNLQRRSAKFLLKGSAPPDPSTFPIEYQEFEVEKVYLQQMNPDLVADDANYAFIRRRTSVNKKTGAKMGSVYQITKVQKIMTSENGDQALVEQKRIIGEREYNEAFLTRDRNRHIVRQRRISFLYEKQSFTIHIYEAPVNNVNLLHAQVEGEDVILPPFLEVERKLTASQQDEAKYGSFSVSLLNH